VFRARSALNVRSVVSLAAIPASFACGGFVTHLALARAPARFAVDLAQPLPVVTAWGSYGAAVFAIFAATLLVAAIAAWSAVRDFARFPATQARTVPIAIVLCAALTLVIALAWPVVYSSDAYAYAAYGDLALRGLDPYALAPPGVHDALLDATRWQWSGTFPVCVYGPGFVALAPSVVALFAPAGVPATLLVLRVLACLTFALAAAFFRMLLEPEPARERNAALAAFALNPVALWSVAEGHNDALMMCFALGGVALIRRGTPFAGGLALGLSPLVKLPAAVAAPLVALYLGARGRVRAALVLCAGFALALAFAAALIVPHALTAAATLHAHGHYAPQSSLQALTGALPAFALCGFIVLAGLWALARGDVQGALWIAIALWIALPNPYPWYALWILPLAAGLRGNLAAGLWAATISGALRYLPDASGPLSRGPMLCSLALQLAPLALAAARDGRLLRARGKATER
jgi:hypothetical protein